MLFNENYAVESVKALVAEFLTTGAFDVEECTIREDSDPYYSGSYGHKVVEDVYMYYCGLGTPSWTIYDGREGKGKSYSLRPNRSTKSILWKCTVESTDEHAVTDMLIIAPTRRLAKLEAQYQLLDSKWGPRKVYDATPISKVDCESIPYLMRTTY